MADSKALSADVTSQLQFQRAHKSAFGFAFGVTFGGGIFLITALHLALEIHNGLPLYLVSQYFQGYDVTWPGAFAGLAWGFAVGFVSGWLLGFVHNFTISLWMFVVRMRHDLGRTKNFLDHI